MNARRMSQPLKCLMLVFLALSALGWAAPQSALPVRAVQTPPAETYWPTSGWRTSTPEEQGMDSRKLAQMLDSVTQQKLALHSLLIIRHGAIVSETYFASYSQNTKHELYSCTKSFTATLVGIAIDQGTIDSVDHRALDYFAERTFENVDALKKAMTLDNLLTMTSGLDWQEGDPAYIEMYRSRDWVKNVLDKPMKEPPGSRFNYCSGCSHILSAIVQKATGTNTRDFAAKRLFEPLGMSDVSWETDVSGTPIGGWGIRITPRDMAKLGYLYLHHGTWDGQQIVSVAWVKTATQQHTTTDDDNLGYGYQWWIDPSLDAYTALGRYGQTIFVIPKFDLIVVTTANVDNHDPIFTLIKDYIVPALRQST